MAQPCTICPDTAGDLTVTRLAAGTSTFSFPMEHVFTTPVRDRASEMDLFELLAVAFTTYRTRVLALPAACAAMMALMVLVNSQSWMLGAEAGGRVLFMRLGAIALMCLPATALTAKLTYNRLVAPALAKP
jgi:hypothetical protein